MNKTWYESHREAHNAATKRNYQAVRQEVLDAYGGLCACCGETTPEFLGIDHINGRGSIERKGMTGYTLYRKLRREGFPKDLYQLLCHNCNQAKGYYRVCPHQIGGGPSAQV